MYETSRLAELAEKQQQKCFYCQKITKRENQTKEHLYAIRFKQQLKRNFPSAGYGFPKDGNEVMACQRCNNIAGSLPIDMKLELLIKLRGVQSSPFKFKRLFKRFYWRIK